MTKHGLSIIFVLACLLSGMPAQAQLCPASASAHCTLDDSSPLLTCAICRDQGKEGKKCRRRSAEQPADAQLKRDAQDDLCRKGAKASRPSSAPMPGRDKPSLPDRLPNPLTSPFAH